MTIWVKQAGNYRVTAVPCPHPGRRVNAKVPTGVLHTIEGSLESGLSVFRRHFAPHFSLGRDRGGKVKILQHIPLGMMAAALENRAGGVETNFEAEVQIELAGHSSQTAWLPDAGVTDALASLMATLVPAARIPLSRPFPEKMPPLPWSTVTFPRRNAGKWGREAGWYGHVEVPENEHWDAGAIRWSRLLELARGKLHVEGPGLPPIGAQDWAFGRWYLGLDEYERFGPRDEKVRPMGYPATTPKAGWRAVEWYKTNVLDKPRAADRFLAMPVVARSMRAEDAPLCPS